MACGLVGFIREDKWTRCFKICLATKHGRTLNIGVQLRTILSRVTTKRSATAFIISISTSASLFGLSAIWQQNSQRHLLVGTTVCHSRRMRRLASWQSLIFDH